MKTRMKILALFFVLPFFIILFIGISLAQVCNLNKPGSLLVYPLINNIGGNTIIEITNRADMDVWIAGYMIVHPPESEAFEKTGFMIHLTSKAPFFWDTSRSYNRVNPHGVPTQIKAFDNRIGFMFVWAVDDNVSQEEIDWDFLVGKAVRHTQNRAFEYNAIPHQVFLIDTFPRVLNLDGAEYCMGTSQIMVGGFSEDWVRGLGGKLFVANLGIDFIRSVQPAFDINFQVWNQHEVSQSRHLGFDQFEVYDLKDDLGLDIDSIFSPNWQFATTSTHALWAVFSQSVGIMRWGGNVWQHPATGVPTTVVLPPVPFQVQ